MNLPEDILNYGLKLSMEFGENWLKDIDDRLAEAFPDLSEAELRACDRLCRKVNKTAHKIVTDNPLKTTQGITFIPSAKFKELILSHYAWINQDNLGMLYSQSCYYARK